ncbi:hypothetical protein C0T31_03290 [Dysgonamonadaceae bacterium]|nr:hypothetical protein C0T31_03290 [Dysgonamonadaceae bacterium]
MECGFLENTLHFPTAKVRIYSTKKVKIRPEISYKKRNQNFEKRFLSNPTNRTIFVYQSVI